MYTLVIKHRALIMAADAYEWYNQQQDGLGETFLAALESAYTKILKYPASYGFIENGFRRIRLRRFPFVVIYEIIEKELIVYAVFHTSRNPDDRLIAS